MEALCVATTVEELYNSVVVETPLAEYFKDCLSASDLDDLNIEIIRNSLYKAYLEDFHRFTQSLGGTTATAMGEIVAWVLVRYRFPGKRLIDALVEGEAHGIDR